MRGGRTAALAAGLALSLLVLTWLALEFVAFPFLVLPRLSHRQRWRLDFPQTILAQSTRSGRLPRRYVALFGDSYALGLGDEWETIDRNGREAFASAPRLRAGTGRDIVSFGHAGAGNVTGYLGAPIAALTHLSGAALYRLEDPEAIVAYFYEGNDLSDNLREIARYPEVTALAAAERGGQAAARRLLSGVAERHPLVLQFPAARGRRALFFSRFAASAALKLRSWLAKPAPRPAEPPTHSRDVGVSNVVRVAGRPVTVPGALQGPALGLSESERREGLLVLEESLRAMKLRFPRAKTLLVYVPSPLSCYEPAAPLFDVEGLPSRTFPSRQVAGRSARLTAEVAAAAARAGADFVDSGPALRAQARRLLIHGPFDWRHFNRYGYDVLASVVLPRLKTAILSS